MAFLWAVGALDEQQGQTNTHRTQIVDRESRRFRPPSLRKQNPKTSAEFIAPTGLSARYRGCLFDS